MRKMKRITTNKFHEVYVTFTKPTTEDEFKRSRLYKKIIKFINDTELFVYFENYQSFYDPIVDGEYDIVNDPDFYSFAFLIKKDAQALAKEFNLELITHDTGEYFTWPPIPRETNPWLPENVDSYEQCMEIYGDIPGDRW